MRYEIIGSMILETFDLPVGYGMSETASFVCNLTGEHMPVKSAWLYDMPAYKANHIRAESVVVA